jgi:hypothetical protein
MTRYISLIRFIQKNVHDSIDSVQRAESFRRDVAPGPCCVFGDAMLDARMRALAADLERQFFSGDQGLFPPFSCRN